MHSTYRQLPKELGVSNLNAALIAVEPPHVLGQLHVPYHHSHHSFETEKASLAATVYPSGVFAFSYIADTACLTFLFDAFSATTREHLAYARDRDGIVIGLQGPAGILDETTFVGGGSRAFWSDALGRLDTHQATHPSRRPDGYLHALRDPCLLQYHASWPARSILPSDSPDLPTTLLMVVDSTHVSLRGHR